jgi:chitinase
VLPQCPFPDANMGSLLNSQLIETDMVFVQFYDNLAFGLNALTGVATQTSDFAMWDNWAKTTSLNKAVKVFLGASGGPTAAAPGYHKVATALCPIITFCKPFSSFGGVAMWDASQVFANTGFWTGVRSKL